MWFTLIVAFTFSHFSRCLNTIGLHKVIYPMKPQLPKPFSALFLHRSVKLVVSLLHFCSFYFKLAVAFFKYPDETKGFCYVRVFLFFIEFSILITVYFGGYAYVENNLEELFQKAGRDKYFKVVLKFRVF